MFGSLGALAFQSGCSYFHLVMASSFWFRKISVRIVSLACDRKEKVIFFLSRFGEGLSLDLALKKVAKWDAKGSDF